MNAVSAPMHIMTRDEVPTMWQKRQEALTDLLAGS